MSKNTNTTNTLIFKSRRTLLEQLKFQGYNTSEYENFTPNQVHILSQNNQLDMLVENDNKDKTYVKYIEKIPKPDTLYSLIDEFYRPDDPEELVLGQDDNLILVINNEPNDTILSLIKHIWEEQKRNIIVCSMARLQYNILNHILVPKVKKLNNEEKEAIYKKYFITSDKKLPEISRFDPMSISIGLKPGELCEITRPSKTSIESKYYRLCLNV